MAEIQWGMRKPDLLDSQDFINNLMVMKLTALDTDMENLKKRVDKSEQEYHLINDRMNNLSVYEDAGRKTNANVCNFEKDDALQECRDISERAVEILTKWGAIQDIKLQIQFAAVTVGKIDRLKKNEHIRSDEVKKKICTLLRSVIRLNVADDMFSQEQIELLKKGFLLLINDNVKKDDLLQLNRALRKENLITMPTWE